MLENLEKEKDDELRVNIKDQVNKKLIWKIKNASVWPLTRVAMRHGLTD